MTEWSDPRDGGGPVAFAHLHDGLVSAAARLHPGGDARPAPVSRPRRPAVLVLAAAAAVVVLMALGAVVVLGLRSDDAVADVNVTRDGASVTVSVRDDVAVADVFAALRDAGVDARVIGQTTGPSRVNRFVGLISPAGTDFSPAGSSDRVTFRSTGRVTLVLGVPARPGEPYAVPTDPSAPGEPLAGVTVTGRPVGEVLDEIAGRPGGGRLRVEVLGVDMAPLPRTAATDAMTVEKGWVMASNRIRLMAR